MSDTTPVVMGQLLDEVAALAILVETALGANNSNELNQEIERTAFRDIGRGSCGSVFEIPGTALAIKKGADTGSIWNDFDLTNTAYNSYLSWAGIFPHRIPRVPKATDFNGPRSDKFWAANLTRFPPGDQERGAAFHLDRIQPLPESTRQDLIQVFFKDDKEIQSAVGANPENNDCLIRVYLGQNNPNPNLFDHTDTLRNFPLYLDQAKTKTNHLDVDMYAETMAKGLAVLHWDAEIDSQDTEFVLGCSTTAPYGVVYGDYEHITPPDSTIGFESSQETHLWMIDYDKCARVDLHTRDPDKSPVKAFFVAVTGNDPYFPRSGLDPNLWSKFRAAYLEASKLIIKRRRLSRRIAQLPQILMDQWEEWGKRDFEAEDADPFDRSGEADKVADDAIWNSEDMEGDDSEDNEDWAIIPPGPATALILT